MRAADLDLRGVGGLRPIPERREHLSGLVGVVIDRLLAEEDEVRVFLFHEREKRLRRNQRLDRRVGLHQDGPVGAHGEGGAQLLLGVGDADAHGQHLDVADALLDAQSLLERDLIERIEAHLDAVEHDPAAVGLDPHAHVVVDHALHTHHDFLHQRSLSRPFRRTFLRLGL